MARLEAQMFRDFLAQADTKGQSRSRRYRIRTLTGQLV
jgi:hypothetical protein